MVLIGAPQSNRFFAIDYSPINQTAPGVVKSLIMGKSVPAEIRIRVIDAGKILNVLPLGDFMDSVCLMKYFRLHSYFL